MRRQTAASTAHRRPSQDHCPCKRRRPARKGSQRVGAGKGLIGGRHGHGARLVRARAHIYALPRTRATRWNIHASFYFMSASSPRQILIDVADSARRWIFHGHSERWKTVRRLRPWRSSRRGDGRRAARQSDRVTGRQGDKATGRQDDRVTGRQGTGRQGDRATGLEGERATWRQGGRATGLQGERAAGRQGGRATGRQGDRATWPLREMKDDEATEAVTVVTTSGRTTGGTTERQGDRATGRQGGRATGRQGDRATGRQGDRATGLQGERATGRQGDRATGWQGDMATQRDERRRGDWGRDGRHDVGTGGTTERQGDRATGWQGDRVTGRHGRAGRQGDTNYQCPHFCIDV